MEKQKCSAANGTKGKMITYESDNRSRIRSREWVGSTSESIQQCKSEQIGSITKAVEDTKAVEEATPVAEEKERLRVEQEYLLEHRWRQQDERLAKFCFVWSEPYHLPLSPIPFLLIPYRSLSHYYMRNRNNLVINRDWLRKGRSPQERIMHLVEPRAVLKEASNQVVDLEDTHRCKQVLSKLLKKLLTRKRICY